MNHSIYDISATELESLPTPIAVPAKRYADERDPRIKLALMIDTIETIYKYGSAIVVQFMRQRKDWQAFNSMQNKSGRKSKSTIELLKQPTLGEHTEIISRSFYHFRDAPPTPPILDCIQRLTQNDPRVDILNLRNRRKGHGAWPDESVALTWLKESRFAFRKVLGIARDLNRDFPLYVQSADERRFSGPTPNLSAADDSTVTGRRLFVRDANGQLRIQLYPLFLCEKSGSVIYNGFSDIRSPESADVTFLDYFTGGDVYRKLGHPVASDFKQAFLAGVPAAALTSEETQPVSTSPASLFTGRVEDLQELDAFVRQTNNLMRLVTGVAGVGKSTLLAKWSESLEAVGTRIIRLEVSEGSSLADPLVLCRCLLEQLRALAGIKPSEPKEGRQPYFHEQLAELLATIPATGPLVILVDGVDESAVFMEKAGRSGSPLDWLPDEPGRFPHVRWTIGLRSHYLKDPAIECLRRTWQPSVQEVLPFDAGDVADYLSESLDRASVQQKTQLMPMLLEKSGGIPLYLHLFTEDVRSGRIAFTEEGIRTLPPSLVGKWEQSLARLEEIAGTKAAADQEAGLVHEERLLRSFVASGRLSEADCKAQSEKLRQEQCLSGTTAFQDLFALLAVVGEPVTADTIAELLATEPSLIASALTLANPFLCEGLEGFSYLHTSFREFVVDRKHDWLHRVEVRLVRWCADSANRLRGYTIRHGIRHLLTAFDPSNPGQRPAEIEAILTDLRFITAKIRARMLPELLADYQRALRTVPGWNWESLFDLDRRLEDHRWELEARVAVLEGKPTPHPDKGGAAVAALLREQKMKREQELKERQEAPECERNADYDAFEAFLNAHQEPPVQIPIAAEQSGPVDTLTEKEQIAENRKSFTRHASELENEAALRSIVKGEVFPPDSITDRTARGILLGRSDEMNESTGSRVTDFTLWVESDWQLIENEVNDVDTLAFNSSEENAVHQSGKAALLSRPRAWIENMFREKNPVRRYRLAFPELDRSRIDGGYISPCAGFRRWLRASCVCRSPDDPISCRFELLDALQNTIIGDIEGDANGPSDCEIDAAIYDGYRINVTDDAVYARFMYRYWELDWDRKSARQIRRDDLDIQIRSQLGEPPQWLIDVRLSKSKDNEDWRGFALSADACLVVVREKYGSVLFMDGRDGAWLGSHSFESGIYGSFRSVDAFLSADGSMLVVGGDKGIEAIEVPGKRKLFQASGEVKSFTATADGRLLAVDMGGLIRIWDIKTDELLREFSANSTAHPMHFSASGELLYAHGEIVDLRTGCSNSPLKEAVLESQFDKSDRFMILDRNVRDLLTYDLYSWNGDCIALNQLEQPVNLVLNGDRVACMQPSCCVLTPFQRGGLQKVIDIHNDDMLDGIFRKRLKGNEPRVLPPGSASAGGKIVHATTDGHMSLIDMYSGVASVISRTADLVTLDRTVPPELRKRALESPQERQERETCEFLGISMACDKACGDAVEQRVFEISAVVLSSCETKILTATDWEGVRVWDVASGKCERVIPMPEPRRYASGLVAGLVLSSNDQHLFLILRDGCIHKLTDWRSAECMWEQIRSIAHPEQDVDRDHFQSYWVAHRRFLFWGDPPYGSFVKGKYRKYTEIFDIVTGEHVAMKPAQVDEFGSPLETDWEPVSITPDGSHIVLCSHDEDFPQLRIVRRSGEDVARFPLPTIMAAISEVQADGRFAVLVCGGNLLRLRLHLHEKDSD